MKGIASLIGLQRRQRALAFALMIGVSFAACWLLFPAAKAACGCIFFLGLICASCVDFDQMIIPDLFTIGLAAVGLVLSFAIPSLHVSGPFMIFNCLRSGAAALVGLAIGSALVLWISLFGELIFGKEVLGFGDVKFLGAIGAFCGWQGAIFSVFGGAAVGVVVLASGALLRRITGKQSVRVVRVDLPGAEMGSLAWGAEFPFGPKLATAAALYFLVLHPWVDRYLASYLALL